MSQPLLATARIELQITVAGLLHKVRAYVGTPSVSSSDYSIPNRSASPVQVADAAQGFWAALRGVYSDAVGAPNAQLQTLVGTLWTTISAYTLTDPGLVASPTSLASQMSVSIRDTAFKKIHLVILEHCQGYIGHSANGAGLGVPVSNMLGPFNGTVVTTGFEPYLWQKSRGDRYILASGMIAGVTLDTNDKVRRARNLT